MITKEQLYKFISKQAVTFLASVDGEGFPNTKAMFAPRKIEDNHFYFSTNASSLRAQQYLANPKASIYFYSKSRYKFEGIMLVGTIEVLQDQEAKNAIWQDGDTMYYRQGVTDPDYCVLRFTAIRGRRYSNFKTENFVFDELM